MTAGQKKITMVVMIVVAGGLLAYQLAPAFGFGATPSKPAKKGDAQVQFKPGMPRRAALKGKAGEAAGATPQVAGQQSPARSAAGPRGPRRSNGSNGGEENPGAEQEQPAVRRASPSELAELLEDSEFAYECEGLRNPVADLILAARKQGEAAEPSYRPGARLDGVLWNETRPMAIIGGKLYEKGQSFDGKSTILEIHASHIVVGYGVETFGISVSGLSAPSVSALPIEMHAETRPAPHGSSAPYPLSDEPTSKNELWEIKAPCSVP